MTSDRILGDGNIDRPEDIPEKPCMDKPLKCSAIENNQRRRNGEILEAAFALYSMGRQRSAASLLNAIIDNDGKTLIEVSLSSMARRNLSFALLCLKVITRNEPTCLDDHWAAIGLGTAGSLMEPELLKARLYDLKEDKGKQVFPAQAGPDLCYVLSISLPQDTTGYSMRTQSVVAALQDHGLELHCLTRPGFPWHRGLSGPVEPARIGSVIYHRCGNETHHIPGDFASFLSAEIELTDRISRICPRAIMAASNHQTAIPAMFAARRLGLPFIYDVRGFWEYSQAAKDPAWSASDGCRIARELEVLTARHSDLVLTLNSAMRDELILRGVNPEKIFLFPNAADPERFSPRKRSSSLARKLQIEPDTPVIGYVGSFNKYEGLDDLVAAGIALDQRGYDFRMVIVGSDQGSETSILDSLRLQAATAGISEKIILPGRVPADEVAEWYSIIDISPIPRKPEKVTKIVPPLKPLEAMAMGKCVVVPDLPPLAEIIQHRHTGMVYRQGDGEDLVETFSVLINEPSLRQRLGAAARDWASRERNWSVASKTAVEQIRKLI